MRTTVWIDEKLLEEAKKITGTKTKKETIDVALRELAKKGKAKKLLGLEGKIELTYSLPELIKRRRNDVPY